VQARLPSLDPIDPQDTVPHHLDVRSRNQGRSSGSPWRECQGPEAPKRISRALDPSTSAIARPHPLLSPMQEIVYANHDPWGDHYGRSPWMITRAKPEPSGAKV
jgi:hypothetical protein